MKIIRWIVGRILLLWNWLTWPKPAERHSEAQAQVNQVTGGMALYQFEACPFCVRVRRAMRRLNLNIELRDARNNPQHKEDLLKQGGSPKVPCLRIKQEGQADTWMYESKDIIAYLEQNFSLDA